MTDPRHCEEAPRSGADEAIENRPIRCKIEMDRRAPC
jgi:hypothetical protein